MRRTKYNNNNKGKTYSLLLLLTEIEFPEWQQWEEARYFYFIELLF